MLYSYTLIVNYVFLVTAVWLGMYVITRSPRSLSAWLTGFTLWSIAGLFLNLLLALNPPPLPEHYSSWMRVFLFPFWPAGSLESGASGWLQGWLVAPAVVTWHHVTVLLRPGRITSWRKATVLFGYICAGLTIIVVLKTPWVYSSIIDDPLFLNSMKAGPLFPYFIGLILLFAGLSLFNLLNSIKSLPIGIHRNQLLILIAATISAGFTIPTVVGGSIFDLPIPMVLLSIFLGFAVMLLGYGVARYSSLMEGRTIRRDFLYNAFAVGLITCLYLGITWLSAQIYDIPEAAFIFVILLAIVTHSLIDIGRRTLDLIFYQKGNRQLRANLRRLASLVGEQDIDESLSNALSSMCTSVRATFGLILCFEGDEVRQIAKYQWTGGSVTLSPATFSADDVLHLEPDELPAPLQASALLIPLYVNADQIGAIVFGRPVNGIHYSPADASLLLYPSDYIAERIQDFRQESAYLDQLSQLAQTQALMPPARRQNIPVKVVEDALRNQYDYAYLGDTPLAALKQVRALLPKEASTHIDLGKAVQKVISGAVEKLRPEADQPAEPIPREWFPFIILNDAYLEDKPNRDIMARLYISEGTFNRTRRSAIRSVARLLEEMEKTYQ